MSFGNDDLAVPAIEWIGVLPSDIKKMGLPWLSMTREDEMRVVNVLARPYVNTTILTELLLLQKSKQKCEIEAVSTISSTYLVDTYITGKIQEKKLTLTSII